MIGVARLVEALRYKPEGRGLDSRLDHCHKPYRVSLKQGSNQPLTKMTIPGIIPGGLGGRCVGLPN